MLRKFSNSRTLGDNIKLGTLTAFAAGMVNVASLLLFLSFSSNVTGYYAIVAAEIVKGNWYQTAVVFGWVFLFFLGSFTANFMVIHLNKRNKYFAHSLPISIEILCMMAVGLYGEFFYNETLVETEALLALMLFAMGLQNGLTASISNFAVKTTHLTGTTTDLGILFSMFTKNEFRSNPALRGRALLLSSITISYVVGGVFAGIAHFHIGFKLFYIISLFLVIVIGYDAYKISMVRYQWISVRKKNRQLLTDTGAQDNIPLKTDTSTLEKERSVC
ncbi:Uncharacterized membrane protein YoaK, UPF0700 family [Parapedobacter composti]|uniref:Uncharacterized membrane protein YoaK, UPF0700 family n=1 Tax=Parapedobacter composti TaxID=623281 RepID=A0A1I1M6S8_9SPHI|nr:YoaK family protein [Parapedobacter composti]SFC81207.1 Uncharacterized membrane protein YoaK, UPF0700 family [Parapedobacter composti]